MASLKERIDADLKEAMRSKDELGTSVLRMLKSAVKYKEVEPGAHALALRGIWLIEAISPKTSPFLTVAMTLPFAARLTSPSRSRYILSLLSRRRLPLSFSANSVVPAASASALPAELKNSTAIAGS